MRVIFVGNDPWSVPTLEALADAGDLDVELVITNPPRPAGRGSRVTPTAVADVARRLDIEPVETEGVRAGEGFEAIQRIDPDAVVVVAYGHLVPPDVLDMPRLGTLNLHFSLLPRWRGAAPVQRAILEGDERTGVSVMLLDEGLDTGPVLARREERIRPDDESGSLGERLAALGADLMVSTLRALGEGTVSPAPQDHSAATYAPKIEPQERTIDWRHPADSVVRRVRALAPAPGAATTFRGSPLKVLRAAVRDLDGEGVLPAGEVHVDVDGSPFVVAGSGAVTVLEVAPAGRARMSGGDWARGARLERGERLG